MTIDWNHEPTVAEAGVELAKASHKLKAAQKDVDYWNRKLLEAVEREGE